MKLPRPSEAGNLLPAVTDLVEELERSLGYHAGPDPPDSARFGDYWLCTTPTTGGQSLWVLPWLFLYTSADPTFPWQFIGGTPIISAVMADASQSMAASAFQSPYPTDPNMDLARAGNYLVRIGATVRPATSACSVFLGLRVGSSDPIIDAQWCTGGYCPVASGRASLGAEIPISVVGAGTHLQLRYWQNGSTQNFVRNNAFISVIPYNVA